MHNVPVINKYRAIVLMFVFHAIGVGFGAGVTYCYFSSFTNKLVISSAAAGTGTKVAILHRLRDGKTNDAMEVLETLLDGDLLGLHAALYSTSASQRDPSYARTLQRAREYRTRYPHFTQYPDLDVAVSNALHSTDEHDRK